jgi:hypothetical protein
MHKDVPHGIDQSPENLEERRVTFWSLYAYETCVLYPICGSSITLVNTKRTAGFAFMQVALRLCH